MAATGDGIAFSSSRQQGPVGRVHDIIVDGFKRRFAARRSQKSSKRPLRMQQRRAMMALAARGARLLAG